MMSFSQDNAFLKTNQVFGNFLVEYVANAVSRNDVFASLTPLMSDGNKKVTLKQTCSWKL